MNFWKRAWLSVTRRKGKSIILFVLVFVLANVIAGAIAVRQSTINTEKNMKEQLGANATVTLDIKKFDKALAEGKEKDLNPVLKADDVKKIGALPYVKYYDYNVQDFMNTEKLKAYHSKEELKDLPEELQDSNDFVVKGVNLPDVLEIKKGDLKLIKGRTFTKNEVKTGDAVVLISQKVADANNLNVGDKMVVDRIFYNIGENGEMKKTDYTKTDAFKVIGIYEQAKAKEKKAKKDVALFTDSQLQNTIFMPNKLAEKNYIAFYTDLLKKFPKIFDGATVEQVTEINYGDSNTFVLKKPEDIEAFKKEAKAYVPDMMKLVTSSDQYDKIAGSVKNMRKMANIVLIVAIAAAVLIISLVIILFLRDRKHELGIYLSLGEKKGKVIGQIVVEVLTISLVAITLSMFTGNLLAKSASDYFVKEEIKKEDRKEEDTTGGMMYFNNEENLADTTLTNKDIQKNYQVSLNAPYILTFYGASLVVILLSTVVPLLYILRLNPKKIMM